MQRSNVVSRGSEISSGAQSFSKTPDSGDCNSFEDCLMKYHEAEIVSQIQEDDQAHTLAHTQARVCNLT